jgi:transcriptional regulator with XRE-family HTH domain
MSTGSVVVRRSLGRRLKSLRVRAGKSIADVTTAQIASRAKIHRIEAGTHPVKMADVRALCWLYGADEETTDLLAELALNTASQSWWEEYGDAMPSWFALYTELETASAQLWTYDPELVHGLLQTEAYQRAVFEADPALSTEWKARQVEMRSRRQRAAFERPVPLRVTSILGEGALARRIGGPDVHARQIDHLRGLTRDENVEVRVLPWDVGAHVAMKGPFTLLDFDQDDDPSVVYLETVAGSRYIEQGTVVAEYRRRLGIIRAQSISLEEYSR